MQKWIEQARDLGIAPEVKDYYEMNARRLVTTWGGDLNDYACRNWGGLLSAYYAQRWFVYLEEMFDAVSKGKDIDTSKLNGRIKDIQDTWPTTTSEYFSSRIGLGGDDFDEMQSCNILEMCRLINNRFGEQFKLLKKS